jgi:Zn-dependent protease with chaperone function
MAPSKLCGLRPQTYEHPSDASALDALSHNAGLDKLIRKLNGWGFERILRVELMGSYLRATPDNFSELHGLLVKACDILDMPEVPGLYIAGGALNAFTAGVEKLLIVLYSGAIEALTNEEMLFVIAHELGHIKSAHVLYYQVAKFLPVIGEIVGTATLGLGELFGMGVEVALLRWQRMSEFTADRAGLLGCQDTDLALRTLMKLAGLPAKYFSQINTEDFIAQARDFESMDTDKLTVVAKWLSTMGATHPWTVMRAKQLLEWVDTGSYDQVLRAPQALPFKAPAGVSRFCTQCGFALRGMEGFCPGCGRPLAKPAAV